MKETDYSQIALRYDKNRLRHDIARDENIEKLYITNSSRLRVLDLACGTGNYIKNQIQEYGNHVISWVGIDKSPEMLKMAYEKNIRVKFILGDACQIPLQDRAIDYVKIRFAFHHFSDKEKVITEVRRILSNNGAVSIQNLSHDYMKYSWVYKYFPGAESIDRDRFPSTLDIHNLLIKYGFETTVNIQTTIRRFAYKDIIEEVENRDMSQLNLISEDTYRTGLDAMKQDAERVDYLVGDISFLDIYAEKST